MLVSCALVATPPRPGTRIDYRYKQLVVQPERHRVVKDRVHGQSEECHEAEEDEYDLDEHDGNLTERAHGAHLRREVERRVMVHEDQRDAEEHQAEPPPRGEAVDEGVRLGRHIVVVSGFQSPERDEFAPGRSFHLDRQRLCGNQPVRWVRDDS